MIDRDLAEMYGVTTSRLNEQVKRNIERFPEHFMFQLNKDELENWMSQIAISNEDRGKPLRSQNATLKNRGQHRKYLPYAFTEQGISMLSAVLRSKIAIEVSIKIMDAFVEMRKFIATNATIFQRLDRVEHKQIETDQKFEQIFKAIEDKSIKPQQGIFYDGQVFDAYIFVADLIKSAKKSILLIDNYIDESVLQLFTKRKENISVSIYTKNITKILRQDLEKHNTQHQNIAIEKFTKVHLPVRNTQTGDRFLIIDETTVYHFGASLKDLGKKWFAFSKMDLEAMEMIANLKNGGGDE